VVGLLASPSLAASLAVVAQPFNSWDRQVFLFPDPATGQPTVQKVNDSITHNFIIANYASSMGETMGEGMGHGVGGRAIAAAVVVLDACWERSHRHGRRLQRHVCVQQRVRVQGHQLAVRWVIAQV